MSRKLSPEQQQLAAAVRAIAPLLKQHRAGAEKYDSLESARQRLQSVVARLDAAASVKGVARLQASRVQIEQNERNLERADEELIDLEREIWKRLPALADAVRRATAIHYEKLVTEATNAFSEFYASRGAAHSMANSCDAVIAFNGSMRTLLALSHESPVQTAHDLCGHARTLICGKSWFKFRGGRKK